MDPFSFVYINSANYTTVRVPVWVKAAAEIARCEYGRVFNASQMKEVGRTTTILCNPTDNTAASAGTTTGVTRSA